MRIRYLLIIRLFPKRNCDPQFRISIKYFMGGKVNTVGIPGCLAKFDKKKSGFPGGLVKSTGNPVWSSPKISIPSTILENPIE